MLDLYFPNELLVINGAKKLESEHDFLEPYTSQISPYTGKKPLGDEMNKLIRLIAMLCLLCFANSLSYAQEKYNEERGQLLYTTYCNACHTTQVHWREQKLVKDWESLLDQVRRWQYIGGLSWSEEEIRDVASHLDKIYYHHRSPAKLIYKD